MKKLQKLALLGILPISGILGLTSTVSTPSAHASAAFPTYTGVSHDSLDPMGSVTYTANKGYNIADGESGAGYYSGGTQYIGPRNGKSAAAAISTIQVKVSTNSKGTSYKVSTIKTNTTNRTQPAVGPRLDAVPNLSFKGISSSKLSKGTQTVNANSYKINKGYSAKTAFDGNSNGMIKVNANRMDTNTGYRLMAAVSPLNNSSGQTLSKIRLSLDTTSANGSVTGTMANMYSSTGNAKTILVGDSSTKGENGIQLTSKNAKLRIYKAKNIKSGTYQANVVWTLANSADASASAANAKANRTPSDLS